MPTKSEVLVIIDFAFLAYKHDTAQIQGKSTSVIKSLHDKAYSDNSNLLETDDAKQIIRLIINHLNKICEAESTSSQRLEIEKHMNSDYLIHGTNSLKGALKIIRDEDSYKYDKNSISLFLSYACNVLKILERDEKTLDLIVEGSRLNDNYSKEYSSYNNFIQKFLVADKAIMLSSGMDKKVVNYLFKDMEKMQRVLESQENLTVENLKNRIHELSYFACEESPSVIGHKEIINRTIQVVGGAAIVVVNASHDSVLTGAASSLSQAFGGYVLGKGLDGLNSKMQKA